MNKDYSLILGDAIKELKKLPDNSIDLVATDPPYKVTSRGNAGNSGGMLQKKLNLQGNVFKYNDVSMADYIPELFRILKEGSHLYIMTNHINLYEMLTELSKAGFHFIKSLIWDKGNKIMGQAYMSQFEYVLFCRKGAFKIINNPGTSDILYVPNKKTKDGSGGNIHDTEKPVRLMEILIGNSTQEGELVLDPFMGSGSTGVASLNLNRKFIGIEIDEQYYQIVKERIEGVPDDVTWGPLFTI